MKLLWLTHWNLLTGTILVKMGPHASQYEQRYDFPLVPGHIAIESVVPIIS